MKVIRVLAIIAVLPALFTCDNEFISDAAKTISPDQPSSHVYYIKKSSDMKKITDVFGPDGDEKDNTDPSGVTFVLGANISYNGDTIASFKSNLLGNGYTLTVNKTLFASSDGAKISGLVISASANISGSGESVGIIVNDAADTTFTNVFVKGNINTKDTTNIGLIAGKAVDCTVTRCGAVGNITADYENVVDSNSNTGGLIGDSEALITNSFYSGTITVTDPLSSDSSTLNVGGLVGINQVGIAASLMNGHFNVTSGNNDEDGAATVNIGGIAGSNSGNINSAVVAVKEIITTFDITVTLNLGRVVGDTSTGSSMDNNYGFGGMEPTGLTGWTSWTDVTSTGKDGDDADITALTEGSAFYEGIEWRFGSTGSAPWQAGEVGSNWPLPKLYTTPNPGSIVPLDEP
ncbi:hypothetical protein FACS189494_01370 [Spirochaetia bacterium]|nr:hypothetical protein FACS189494_01370 [Spirochaetia bacterium]